MAALIERNGIYYAQFVDVNGLLKRKRHSLKTNRKDVARRKLAKWERDYELGQFNPWLDDPHTYDLKQQSVPLTLHVVAEHFLTRKKEACRSDNTLRTYREVLCLFENHVGSEILLDRINLHQCEAFVRESSLSKATQHKRFGHLRTFFRWCTSEGKIKSNPLSSVEAPSKPHKLPKAVTEDELQRICDTIHADYQMKRQASCVGEGEMLWRIPLFRFAFYTGMRGSELARLRWNDVDFQKRLIYIKKQKNKKEQTIPLNNKAAQILKEVDQMEDATGYVFKSPRFKQSDRSTRTFVERASRAFREARKAAGIKRPVCFHSLRHGFCTKLAEAGKPLYVIMEAARHADISTSMIYVHMANEHLKAELDDVFG